MFRSWLRARARKSGAITLTGLVVLVIVLATTWTATVQRTHVAAPVDNGRAPAVDAFNAVTGLTKPRDTATTAAGSTDSTAVTSTSGTTDLTFTVIPVSLTIAKTHTDTFLRGEDGVYTITVGNLATASPTNGTTVTVQDTLPAGLRAETITGSGWDCVLSTLTCTRSDVLAAGQSYPPITLEVEVSCEARSQVTNTVTVTGGGDATTHTATDPTTIERNGHGGGGGWDDEDGHGGDGHGHDGHGGHHGHHGHCDRQEH